MNRWKILAMVVMSVFLFAGTAMADYWEVTVPIDLPADPARTAVQIELDGAPVNYALTAGDPATMGPVIPEGTASVVFYLNDLTGQSLRMAVSGLGGAAVTYSDEYILQMQALGPNSFSGSILFKTGSIPQ